MVPPTPSSDFFADAPVVDSDRIDHIYRILDELNVELDADPLELGPKRLNQKVSECRAMLSRCEKVFLDTSKDLHWYKRRYRAAQAEHGLRVQELLANDPTVRSGQSIRDREAMANMKLRGFRDDIDRLHSAVEDLEAVLTVIKTKRNDLKDTQGRLKDQLKICQEEIGLGGRWGSNIRAAIARGGSMASFAKKVDLDESLDELLDSAIAQQGHLSAAAPVAQVSTSSVSEDVVITDNSSYIEGAQSDTAIPPDESQVVNVRGDIHGSATADEADAALANLPDFPASEGSPDVRIPKMLSSEDLDDFLDLV